jgi:hypothetical protein
LKEDNNEVVINKTKEETKSTENPVETTEK